MGSILSSLVSLQAIETKVRRTNKELDKIQQMVLKQQRQNEQLAAAIEAKKEEIKLSRIQSDKLELDLKSREERITRMRVALNSAKTNKEYSAILTKINTDKADNNKLEDQILALMTLVDKDKTSSREIEQSIAIGEERFKEVQDEARQKKQVIQAKLDEFNKQRQVYYQEVPRKLQIIFDRLADRFDGEVLAKVDKMNGSRGDYSCGGCYMSIPLESVNSLMTRDDTITCPNCGRVLVLDLNPKQQPTT